MKKLLLACAFLPLASAALAAGADKQEPYDWSGFYAGVNGGFTWLDVNPKYPAENVSHASSGGLTGGAQFGANLRIDRFLLGIEGDVQASNAHGKAILDLAPSGQTIDTRLDWFATLRARFGYLVSDRAVIYATGGLATARTETTIDTTYGQVPWTGQSSHVVSENRSGWSAGAGGEFALDANWSVKAEYLYIDLGAKSHYFLDPVGGGALAENLTGSDVKFQTVRFGLNYKF